MQIVDMNKKFDNNLVDLQAFQGATLLDEQGHEIPITEEMIVNACDELMKLWHFPAKKAA
ncbi:PA1571 family protein [Agitococcus lubricus]|uniref:Uncharacterized protein n=1 Tax=Agitococcus lubricus TaxID=1077255 RepID=A0A2T5IWZ3_9GAMM|nr:PA1571 family protein [Agitococcus lubricus]PTQ88433.1 hypothetical protein C8N29_11278 [Agitococcus lubricus]